MKLDCYGAQYGGQAAVIGQKIETSGGNFGRSNGVIAAHRLPYVGLNQAVSFQVKHVSYVALFRSSIEVLSERLNIGRLWECARNIFKQFALIFALKFLHVWRPCQFKLFKMITRLTPLNQGGVQ